MSTLFFILDLAVAFGLPVCVHLYHRTSELDHSIPKLFWLGVLIGAFWEVPLFLSATYSATPVLRFLSDPPVHPLTFMLAHSLWDGGLFLGGVLLVRLLLGDGVFRRFRPAELLVFMLWGQASALAVEVGGISASGWSYVIPHAWNVELFRIKANPITILPQLIWLAAPLVYYLIAVRLVKDPAQAG